MLPATQGKRKWKLKFGPEPSVTRAAFALIARSSIVGQMLRGFGIHCQCRGQAQLGEASSNERIDDAQARVREINAVSRGNRETVD